MRRHAVLGLFLLASCSAGHDVPQATQAIAQFHRLLDAGQFDAIYSGASNEMKAASPRERLVAILTAVHRKLGMFRSGSVKGWNDMVNTSGHFITISYASRYDRDANAVEQFNYRIDGDHASLVGYNISSTSMMLN